MGRKRIDDEFSGKATSKRGKPLSPALRYYYRHKRDGLCVLCSEPALPDEDYCERHMRRSTKPTNEPQEQTREGDEQPVTEAFAPDASVAVGCSGQPGACSCVAASEQGTQSTGEETTVLTHQGTV